MVFDEVFLVVVLVSLLIALFACSLILFVIQYKRKQQMHTMETAHMAELFKAQLLQTRLEVQEQSLKYFSEEIHDNIGQALSLVKLNLYQVRQCINDSEPVGLVDQGSAILGKAIRDLRSISHRLNGDFVANEGIDKMLSKELDYLNSSKAINGTFDVTGEFFPLGAEKELLIFRIMQESIANAVKHAGAKNITVTLDYGSGYFTAAIQDDGIGFNPNRLSESGLGLINMRSRAALLNASLDIFSELHKGTTVQLKIPIPNERHH